MLAFDNKLPKLGGGVLSREMQRFLVTGSINTVFCWMVYLLLNLVVPYPAAYTGAYMVGTVFSYFLNTRWVFRVPMNWRTFLQFPSVYVVQYGLGVALVWVLVEAWPRLEPVAPLVVVGLTMPVTFLLSRFILKRGIAKQVEQVRQLDAGEV